MKISLFLQGQELGAGVWNDGCCFVEVLNESLTISRVQGVHSGLSFARRRLFAAMCADPLGPPDVVLDSFDGFTRVERSLLWEEIPRMIPQY